MFSKSVDELAWTSKNFPPYGVDPQNFDPIIVYLNIVFRRLDAIEPHNGRWVVRMQTDMYWDESKCHDCPGTSCQKNDLCSNRFGDLFCAPLCGSSPEPAPFPCRVQT